MSCILDLTASPEGVLAATAFGLHLGSDDERGSNERGDDPTRNDSTRNDPTRDIRVRATTEDAVFGITPSDIVDGRYCLGTRTGVSVLPAIGSTPISLPYVDAPVRRRIEGPDGGLRSWTTRRSRAFRSTGRCPPSSPQRSKNKTCAGTSWVPMTASCRRSVRSPPAATTCSS